MLGLRMKRSLSGIMVILLLTSMLALAFSIKPVGASATIYIRADGSIDPPTANITSADNVTYTFTDNNYDEIVVERDNILLDGQGYLLQGTGSGIGITLSGRSNVTLRNIEINAFIIGVWLYSSSDNTVSGNNITNNGDGVNLRSSSDNTISGNNITANSYAGVLLWSSSNFNTVSGNNITNSGTGVLLWSSSNFNTVSGNNITNSGYGVSLGSSYNNTVSSNNITANYYHGVLLDSSSDNTISGNNIADNDYGVSLGSSYNNTIYHNNFVNNTNQVYTSNSVNIWDDGYPSGGNYWSDYIEPDLYRGPYQNETGSDGIGDTPYVIDEDNQDNYPLMNPWTLPDIAIVNITTSKTIIGQEFTLHINITVQNEGNKIEAFDVTTYANTTVIQTKNITLTSGNSTTITFTWNTTSFAKGNYSVSANVTILPGETDTADNTLVDSWVFVTIPGDCDGDRDVDIYDIVCMAGIYGVSKPDPRYDPNCDIDGDGDIDIYDIVAAAGHYGESW